MCKPCHFNPGQNTFPLPPLLSPHKFSTVLKDFKNVQWEGARFLKRYLYCKLLVTFDVEVKKTRSPFWPGLLLERTHIPLERVPYEYKSSNLSPSNVKIAIIEFSELKTTCSWEEIPKNSLVHCKTLQQELNIPRALIKNCLQLLDNSMPTRLRTKHLCYRCFHTSTLPTPSEGVMPDAEAVDGGALPVCVNE